MTTANTMSRIPVHSSGLRSIGYSSDEGTLDVEFRTGEVYRFLMVPAIVWAQLIDASSKGAFFNENVRDRYAHELVEHEHADTLLADLKRSVSNRNRPHFREKRS